MSATIHSVLDDLRARAQSEREKGELFEDLMAKFLRTDPVYAAQYVKVWRWMDYPGRDGKVDTGIDLVAEESGTGDHVAIQCKFYAEDHYLQKGDIDSFFTALGKKQFAAGLIVSTTDKWSKHAEDALADQTKPVGRLRVGDLDLSPVDWSSFSLLDIEYMPLRDRKQVRPHQREAIDAVRSGFEVGNDRGKLIMACGTGKTFTSLRLVEEEVQAGGTVLFLVPSISLLSQTLREWSAEALEPMRFFAVCSDRKVGAGSEDIRVHDLAIPATTNAEQLASELERTRIPGQTTVVFSTYQSIDVIASSQQGEGGVGAFDLVVCDEAHRTTGATAAGEADSAFVRIHDNTVIAADKRLYMTATPRLYDDTAKRKAEESSVLIASMDDESLYGPEFHRLGFGDAVERDLLADYKVLVLAVDEDYIAREFQRQLADENLELKLDDVAKIVGCYNGLEKRALDANRLEVDSNPMRRAVAFSRSIKDSKAIATAFDEITEHLAINSRSDNPLRCSAEHVDGTFNVLARNEKLDWLKAQTPAGQNVCRILSNARCLSEGVDVPSLDAVLFLNPRNSVVDVVQSVGRVMRKAPGKSHGYVILPIGVPAGVEPEEALNDNKKYKVVWQVLQALRAHDDRFDAMVNKLELNKAKDDKLQIIGVGGEPGEDNDGDSLGAGQQLAWSFTNFEQWQDALYAKIVAKVGDRRYWEDWAKDIADIADRHVTRIRAILDNPAHEVTGLFDKFHQGLRANLNDGISRDNAIEMLAQHVITRPVFDALFEDYDFAAHNPVSLVMQDMLDFLDEQGIETETETLERFYDSVRVRAAGIDNAAGKQKIITELYEKFFKNAFPKAADALGIVYTPIEVVDWLLRAANDVLTMEFGQSLSDEGVHVLDGFTGTGTFIVRLIESGIIRPDDLVRKYTSELHANEINLLAYYVAAVNIEATFHGIVGGEYQPFDGIVLTDTFQMHEDDDTLDTAIFPVNNQRVLRQKNADIRVIVGNPPYSAGQTSANDDNANLAYPTLDAKIAATFANRSTATNKNSLYDSYVRAIRWATDRIGDRGIVAFVTNGGWLDGNTADGIRLTLADELSSLYVFNLRGNQRTSGEESRREGGKIFGSGSRNTVAMFVAVKNPDDTTDFQLRYRDIGDCLTREQKLEIVTETDLTTISWQTTTPNRHGDWIGQRKTAFGSYPALGSKGAGLHDPTVFTTFSAGLKTGRDAWAYNFSRAKVARNMSEMIDFYNKQVDTYTDGSGLDRDPARISWNRGLVADAAKRRRHAFDPNRIFTAAYRPFTRQNAYFERGLNDMIYKLPTIFPSPLHRNRGFYILGVGATKPFSVGFVDQLPDLNFFGSEGGQFFPRWIYEKVGRAGGAFDFGKTDEVDEWGYRRIDNVTDHIHAAYASSLGDDITKDQIFHYVYGVLHSPKYRITYAADLKKMLPRIPQPSTRAVFDAFAEAGEQLAELHVGYEDVDPYPLDIETRNEPSNPQDLWQVAKLRWSSKAEKSSIIYNSYVTISGIPDAAHRYVLGSRSGLEWIIDRYQVKPDKASGIMNDPNDWATEQDNPRYILDLIAKVTTVSIETMKIVDHLPSLDLAEPRDVPHE